MKNRLFTAFSAAALCVILTFAAVPAAADLAVSGFTTAAAGIGTFLGTPSSANLKTAVTDETGSAGVVVFATSPTLTTPVLSGTTTGTWTIGGTPTLFAGGGTQTLRAPGELYWERTNGSTSAGSVVPAFGSAYSIPAGTMSTDGDQLKIQASVTLGTASTDNKNFFCNIGYSAFNSSTGAFTGGLSIISESSTSNAGSLSWYVYALVTRYGATSTSFEWQSKWGSSTTTQGSNYTSDTSNITWANANNFLCTVYNVTGSNTQVLTLNEYQLTYWPR